MFDDFVGLAFKGLRTLGNNDLLMCSVGIEMENRLSKGVLETSENTCENNSLTGVFFVNIAKYFSVGILRNTCKRHVLHL